jgi:SAM-dependent methyltransferase
MRPGDFTDLAKAYVHRPAYADTVINALARDAGGGRVADIGAGTGKLTAMLAARGTRGVAVEPNGAMRKEGERLGLAGFVWREGSAEATDLEPGSIDWITMASAFHWAEPQAALREFHRILRPGGALTLLWNPRDLEQDPLQARIEARIRALAPTVRRRSSGAAAYTGQVEPALLTSELFDSLLFLEAPHQETMTRERHLGAWASVNDLRSQVGEAAWPKVLEAITEELAEHETVKVRYRTRAWHVRKT